MAESDLGLLFQPLETLGERMVAHCLLLKGDYSLSELDCFLQGLGYFPSAVTDLARVEDYCFHVVALSIQDFLA